MFLKKFRLIIITIVSIFMLVSAMPCAQEDATNNEETKVSPLFTDVDSSHWAFDAISWMVEKNILSGYEDGSFKPGNTINRAEFAKIMVLGLDLPIKNTKTSSFVDITNDSWEFKYVETAKYYLTGYRTTKGDYFKSKKEAVREDMAVALVKALKLTNDKVDNSILDNFTDSNSISPALKRYVSIAIKNNIMKGSPVENSTKNVFKPQSALTRAEAAVLLYNVAQDQKITYDENKEENNNDENKDEEKPIVKEVVSYPKPEVTAKVVGNNVVVNWSKGKSEGFTYYKVVVSKSNQSPRYPEDGYMFVISDVSKITATITPNDSYNGGDISGKLVPGQKYYFSITAVYGDKKVAGNSISLTFPKQTSTESSAVTTNKGHIKPSVTATISGDKIIVKWQPTYASDFNYYKVVLSKYKSNPKYPEDGYLTYITDRNQTSSVIEGGMGYSGGDFGGEVVTGQKYYISVTNVYSDEKIAGNALYMKIP